MARKLLSIFLSLIICLGMLPSPVYANSSDVFAVYQKAVQATVSSGSWTENLTMEANMTIKKGSAKTKTKATVTSSMYISGYSEYDISNLQISGSTSMKVMGQSYTWSTLYENGIAHYEYIEPNQASRDIKMEPNYFDFYTLTQDMLTDTSMSENRISFTIPGDQLESAGIDAVNLMTGIDDLHYGDVDVEIVTDKSTGAIDTMSMAFHATLSYQGYNTEVDYTINYQFSSEISNDIELDSNESEDALIEPEIENGLIVYSDYKNLSIRKDSTITLSTGVIINGEQIKDVSGITFWTENSNILGVIDTGVQNNRQYVQYTGLMEGTTTVVFTDSHTGYTAKVPITVYADNYLSFTLNSVPTQYMEKYPTNIYNANGLYVDNYSYTINDDKTAMVSFDVYNTNYTYGVVEVCDAEGNVKDAILINKMSSNNTSIKQALWDNTCCLVRDLIDGDFLSYRQESGFSKKTSVSVKIPKNGYIKICNDPENSSIVNIVNSVDILMSLSSVANKVKNYNVNSEAFSRALTSKLVKETVYATMIKDGSELPKDLWMGITKKVAFSPESLGNFSDTILKNLSEFDLESLIADTAIDFGWDIGEKVFTYFTGPIKMVFDGLFTLGKLENIIIQQTNLISSSGVGSIYIQNQGGGTRSSQQIMVESNTELSDDTSLNVFQVTLDSAILNILKDTSPDVYDAIINGMSYTYNISLLKSGEETQPNKEVTVYIPIPSNMKLLAYAGKAKIYRVEEDGTLTEMDVHIKDGYFVFNTSHFSLYTLVGNNISATTIAIGFAVVVFVGIVFITILLRNKKKKTSKRPIPSPRQHSKGPGGFSLQ